jgi:hypothetical protein
MCVYVCLKGERKKERGREGERDREREREKERKKERKRKRERESERTTIKKKFCFSRRREGQNKTPLYLCILTFCVKSVKSVKEG